MAPRPMLPPPKERQESIPPEWGRYLFVSWLLGSIPSLLFAA